MRLHSGFSPDEHGRLAALYALGLLDTPREAAYDRVVRLVALYFGVPFAAIALIDTDRVWMKAAQGPATNEYARAGSLCTQAVQQDGVLQLSGAAAAQGREADLLPATTPLRFFAACPLQTADGLRLGVLWIAGIKSRSLDAVQQQALLDFAAIVDAMLEVLQRAAHDPLTGMANRRGFLLLARQSLAFCTRQGCPATLVLLDVAGLKRINDGFGHNEGDLALLALADLLGKTFRGADSVARLGGDLFAVLLTNVKAVQAALLLNRVADLLQTYNRQSARGYDLAYNCAITEFSVSRHASLEQLLAAAEDDMHQLKHARIG